MMSFRLHPLRVQAIFKNCVSRLNVSRRSIYEKFFLTLYFKCLTSCGVGLLNKRCRSSNRRKVNTFLKNVFKTGFPSVQSLLVQS